MHCTESKHVHFDWNFIFKFVPKSLIDNLNVGLGLLPWQTIIWTNAD